MRASRGVRGVVAGLFVMSVAAVGVGIAAPTAGAGDDGIRCIRPPDIKADVLVQPEPNVGECAQLEVTKVVTGTPAPSPATGTTFSVVVDCQRTRENGADSMPPGAAEAQQLPQGQTPPFTTTITFPEGGGTQSVFITAESECTVSESPPPGCTLTSIDPVTTEIERAIVYPVTVTNNCDPAVEAAVAVVEAPRFTG
jgi:uncharacterized protein DUF5979